MRYFNWQGSCTFQLKFSKEEILGSYLHGPNRCAGSITKPLMTDYNSGYFIEYYIFRINFKYMNPLDQWGQWFVNHI